MRNLAKLRLENEVADLSNVKALPDESESESLKAGSSLPHILIDSYCLISNSVFMSRLLKSKSAVVVVPRKGTSKSSLCNPCLNVSAYRYNGRVGCE